MLRRFLICLAFATWCFLDAWVACAEGGIAYFARHAPLQAVVLPVLCLEFLIALAMLAVWELLRRRGWTASAWTHAAFLMASLAPLGIAGVAALRVLPFDLAPMIRNRWFWPVALIAAIAPVVLILRGPRHASRILRGTFLYSWPVLFLLLVQSARVTWLRFPAAAYRDQAPAPALSTGPARVRVIWIIFDELSQTIAFGNRPAGVQLPELDRLKAESFYASSAESPADRTQLSMPALIVGDRVLTAETVSPNDLEVRTASARIPAGWSSLPNVFDSARALGFDTALVGWFHPYGRLLNRSLTRIYWTAAMLAPGVEERARPLPLPAALADRLRMQAAALPLAGHLPVLSPLVYQREEKIEKLSWLQDRAIEIVTDPRIGLALIHLPVPHPPDAASGSRGYLDNVVLADRILGKLRAAMEQAGLWDRSAILVSADHGWRTPLWRGGLGWTAAEEAVSRQDTSGIPFLLKLPGQSSGQVYSQPFNTVVTRGLIETILSGRLTAPEAISKSIERLSHHQ